MPVKYIGRTTDFCGKPLWEILGNLNNFGVGRLVKRHVFDRYPEPSFFRIVKVEAVEIEVLFSNYAFLCFSSPVILFILLPFVLA